MATNKFPPPSPFAASAAQAKDATSLDRSLLHRLEDSEAAAGRAAACADELKALVKAKDSVLAAQALEHKSALAAQALEHKKKLDELSAQLQEKDELLRVAFAAEWKLVRLRANMLSSLNESR